MSTVQCPVRGPRSCRARYRLPGGAALRSPRTATAPRAADAFLPTFICYNTNLNDLLLQHLNTAIKAMSYWLYSCRLNRLLNRGVHRHCQSELHDIESLDTAAAPRYLSIMSAVSAEIPSLQQMTWILFYTKPVSFYNY